MVPESVLVFLVVSSCFVYALWTLMPQTARRSLAVRLLRWPLPGLLRAVVQRGARSCGACRCHGCDRAAPERVLMFHAKAGQTSRRRIQSDARS